ncbi:MAG: 23S rRNA (adenine(2503)-C(2))-methyltransferase RlmN [PVC group bacterium]|nr:23S rRNA (adenine(2503)-C(2))-methyltransferase RlmN [PVC group bacterium]
MKKKHVISGLFPDELQKLLKDFVSQAYRGRQILDWIYEKNILSFSKMSNLPDKLRDELKLVFEPVSLIEVDKQISSDKTTKYVFKTYDDEYIESVFIPTRKRATICISTQAGCAFGCMFCASGKNGLKRNLSVGEIVSQVLLIRKDNPENPITNIVIMGMGEPLANYENTLKAVRILNHPECLRLAARRITISTCGLPEQILRLAKEGLQIELSISLHAANNVLRNRIVPVNKKYPLEHLMQTARDYIRITNRVITFEYVIIDGVNDTKRDAEQLISLLNGIKCKVNIIPFNPVDGTDFRPPKAFKLEEFQETLQASGVNVTVRRSRGTDIKGACGQLAAHSNNA